MGWWGGHERGGPPWALFHSLRSFIFLLHSFSFSPAEEKLSSSRPALFSSGKALYMVNECVWAPFFLPHPLTQRESPARPAGCCCRRLFSRLELRFPRLLSLSRARASFVAVLRKLLAALLAKELLGMLLHCSKLPSGRSAPVPWKRESFGHLLARIWGGGRRHFCLLFRSRGFFFVFTWQKKRV